MLREALSFGGGPVVTASPKVFLVFWGAGWGSQSTGAGGYDVYSGDPDGLAPNLQALFTGLGTNNEQWSNIVTQYCQGVPFGTKTCPAGAVGEPRRLPECHRAGRCVGGHVQPP